MITSSPCFQFTGVATLWLAVSWTESMTRSTSSKLRPHRSELRPLLTEKQTTTTAGNPTGRDGEPRAQLVHRRRKDADRKSVSHLGIPQPSWVRVSRAPLWRPQP